MDTTQPNAAPRCQHIKDSSYPCGSPALRGKSFCYYHERVHAPIPDPRKNPKAFTPHLESGESIQLFVTNVCRALGSGQLDVKQARTMISAVRALRFAFDLRNEHRGQRIADTLTPAMSNALAECEKCSTDSPVGDPRATTPSTAAVIQSEDARPSEGPRHRPPQPERPRPSNILPTDLSLPLNDEQIAYCRSVLRYGPSHPHFHDCSRRVDKLISARVA